MLGRMRVKARMKRIPRSPVTGMPPAFGRLSLPGLLLSALLLAGCSQTPSWADPTALWDSAFGEDADARPEGADAGDTGDSSFPTLGSTPERPEATSTSEERKAVADSLVADRQNAQYSDETLRAPASSSGPALSPAPPSQPRSEEATAVQRAAGTTVSSPTLAARSQPLPPPTTSSDQATRYATGSNALEERAVTPAPVDTARMQVPSIVQRRGQPPPPPTPVEEVARGSLPAITASRVQTPSPINPDSATMAKSDAMADPAQRSEPLQAPALQERATMNKATMADAAPARLPSTSALIGTAPPSPAAMATAASVNLPVGQDQSTLAQVFASQLAAQNALPSGQVGSLPSAAAGNSAQVASLSPPNRPALRPSGEGSLRLPGAPLVVRFAQSSASVGTEGMRQIREAASLAKQRGGVVRVVGHASQRTADMPYARHKIVNFNISLDRANAVAQALARRGVPRESIIVEARGDEEPLFHEFMPNGEAYNRRVEIFLQ